jgi:hypothetical protein
VERDELLLAMRIDGYHQSNLELLHVDSANSSKIKAVCRFDRELFQANGN